MQSTTALSAGIAESHSEPARNKGLVQPLVGRNDVRGPRIVGGRGAWVEFEDGVRALDAAAQDSSVILGHRHPELRAAIEKASDMVFASDTASGSPQKDAVVSAFLNTVFAKAPWITGVRFTCTGSEAIDIAIALAQTLTRRNAIAARAKSYHGAVGLSREATRFEMLNGGLSHPKGGFTKAISKTAIVDIPLGMPVDEDALASSLREVAIVLTDCGSGHIYPSNSWFEAVGRAARRAGALWLHDETVTGYGRTGGGEWFQSLELSIHPDMIAAGKCVTGGAAPGSVLFWSDRVDEMLDGRRWAVGSTFWGHPLSLAAMGKVIEIVEREGYVAELPARSRRLDAGLTRLAASHPGLVHSIEGTGFNRTIRMKGSLADESFMGDGSYLPVAVRAMEHARLNGVSTPAYGATGLWIVPPFNLTDDEIDHISEGLDAGFTQLSRELGL